MINYKAHSNLHTICCRLQILLKYGTEWIVEIKDVTEFVHRQYEFVKADQLDSLLVAEERVYPVCDPATADQIAVDSYEIT